MKPPPPPRWSRIFALVAVAALPGWWWTQQPKVAARAPWEVDLNAPPMPDVVPNRSSSAVLDSPSLLPVDFSAMNKVVVHPSSLPEVGNVRGRILDAQGGAVAELLVVLIPQSLSGAGENATFDPVRVRTDETGRFAFPPMPEGKFRIRLDRHPFGLIEEFFSLSPQSNLKEWQPTLPAFGTVRGRVVDARGQPAKDVGIYTVGEKDAEGNNRRWGVRFPEGERGSDEEGNFVLRGLPPGNMVLSADGDGRLAEPVAVEVRVGETTSGVTLTLSNAPILGKGHVPGTVRVFVELAPGGPTIQRLPESSLARNLLLPGDRILSVDGYPTRFMSWQEFVWRMAGEPGSRAVIEFERQGKKSTARVERQERGNRQDWL